jgi:hypothetical protein
MMFSAEAKRLQDRERWRLSAITRKASDEGSPIELTSGYRKLIEENPPPSEPEQMDLLLAYIAKASGPERSPVFVDTKRDYPIVGAAGPSGLAFLLNALVEKGLAEVHTRRRHDNVMAPHFQLLMLGYERLEAKRKQPRGATGWERVDRQLQAAEERLASGSNEEDFQSVGHLCRETLISLGQAVYDREQHGKLDDGVEPSATDARRMLEAYIGKELGGGANEEARAAVKKADALADALQHMRMADHRVAALCLEATRSIVEMIAIIAGKRDRQKS